MKVLALDYGSARTGVAVSDPTGTVARPVTTIQYVDRPPGWKELLDVIASEKPERVVVGLPLTLKGERGLQVAANDEFVAKLRAAIDAPVDLFDERFTSVLAGGDDARAAAHLLSTYLAWLSAGR